MPKKSANKKRLVKGRDWHAWAWHYADGRFSRYTEPERSNYQWAADGKWVRVKFVEVE